MGRTCVVHCRRERSGLRRNDGMMTGYSYMNKKVACKANGRRSGLLILVCGNRSTGRSLYLVCEENICCTMYITCGRFAQRGATTRKSGGITQVSTRVSLSMEISRLTRDGTAEPVSRDQILRRERGQGKYSFSLFSWPRSGLATLPG